MQKLLRMLTCSILTGGLAPAFAGAPAKPTATPPANKQSQANSSQNSSSANTTAPQGGTTATNAAVRSSLVVPIHIYESPQIISTNPGTVRFDTNRSTVTVTNQVAPPKY